MRKSGTYQPLGKHNFFTPFPLPVDNPPFQITPAILELYSTALLSLGQLQEFEAKVPDQERFLKSYVIKEAMLSSNIEGINTTIIDLFTHDTTQPEQELSKKTSKETMLVVNYIQAVNLAINMMTHDNLPISSRIILAAHQALLGNVDDQKYHAGNYRKQTVLVGNLTPPMATQIPTLMSNLEEYINNDTSLPPLIQAGLVHVQFETIHPFLDGNGRIGRLLIILMLIDSKLLKTPILYPSYYFKKHQLQYYLALERVQTHGDFEGWITYFLQAITASAHDALIRAQEIEILEKKLIEILTKGKQFKQTQQMALIILNQLFKTPVTNISQLSLAINKTYNTTHAFIKKFMALGIVSEHIPANKQRYKQYHFDAYLVMLEKEYDHNQAKNE